MTHHIPYVVLPERPDAPQVISWGRLGYTDEQVRVATDAEVDEYHTFWTAFNDALDAGASEVDADAAGHAALKTR